jgi:C1A family cysteine protease
MKPTWLLGLALFAGLANAGPEKFKVTATAPSLQESAGDPVTFEYKNVGKTYYTGKLPGVKAESAPSQEFLKADVKLPKAFHLRDLAKKLGVELMGTYNQASCGSCVYNSVMRNATDHLRLRKVNTEVLSRQYGMDCLAEWSCSGSLFEKVAGGLTKVGAGVAEKDYAYQARDQRCKDVSSLTKYGPFKSFQVIDNSPKSVMTALYAGYPVSVTVAADGSWSGYSGGIYNRDTSNSTNHEVLIYGWDAEGAVDSEGNADPSKFSNSQGYVVMENSWGASWGENGAMRTRWGMNALAEEAGILESGIPLPDPNPPKPPAPPVPPTPTPGSLPWWVYVVSGAAIFFAGAFVALVIKK